jgi:hypothetical protein
MIVMIIDVRTNGQDNLCTAGGTKGKTDNVTNFALLKAVFMMNIIDPMFYWQLAGLKMHTQKGFMELNFLVRFI